MRDIVFVVDPNACSVRGDEGRMPTGLRVRGLLERTGVGLIDERVRGLALRGTAAGNEEKARGEPTVPLPAVQPGEWPRGEPCLVA